MLPSANLTDDDLGVLALIMNDKYESAPIETNHYFCNGSYIREMVAPANTLIIGRVHKQGGFVNVLTKGRLILRDESGEVKEVSAPYTFIAKSGGRKTAYTLEDTVWLNIHSINVSTVQDAEAETLEEEKPELKDRFDFIKTISALGMSPDMVQAISEINCDLVDLDMDLFGVEFKESTIHGIGMFATRDFEENAIICPSRICSFRTAAGRYTNHGANPNAETVMLDNHSSHYKATKFIKSGDEIMIDYKQAFDVARTMDGVK